MFFILYCWLLLFFVFFYKIDKIFRPGAWYTRKKLSALVKIVGNLVGYARKQYLTWIWANPATAGLDIDKSRHTQLLSYFSVKHFKCPNIETNHRKIFFDRQFVKNDAVWRIHSVYRRIIKILAMQIKGNYVRYGVLRHNGGQPGRFGGEGQFVNWVARLVRNF